MRIVTNGGYKYQLTDKFLFIREINPKVNTNGAVDVWSKISDSLGQEISDLRKNSKIRIFVHILRVQNWYELEAPGFGWRTLGDEKEGIKITRKKVIDLIKYSPY